MIDHRGQPLGGVADVIDLRGDASFGDPRRRIRQHFGAAEDDAKRVLQVVRDRAEDFVLEGVGALQPQPLRRQPAVGSHQGAGALRDAVFQLRIGLLQLLIQDHIVERDREPAAEDLDQRAIGVGQCRSASSNTTLRGRSRYGYKAPSDVRRIRACGC